jgi:hypothetical protein
MFDYPTATLVNRPIPKSKILEKGRVSARLKDLLTRQVQQIRWHAKLSPETVHLPATDHVPEIQIFQLDLKGTEIHPDLLQLLDKTIPQPILLEIITPDQQVAYSAAYKRPSEADAGQWVVGARFTSDFAPVAEQSHQPLPVALDLGRLYTALLEPLLPLEARQGETLANLIERCSHHNALQKRVAQLTSKVRREKQFNRRVGYNQELNLAKEELNSLT